MQAGSQMLPQEDLWTCSLFLSFAGGSQSGADSRSLCSPEKVYAEKCKKEPLQCLKCQGWGHMACDCIALHDTCGTCAQHHRMDTCTNIACPHCVSCGLAGHSSWDRSCPVFLRKCSGMNDRLEENNMPYFPTSEVWTQVKEPPKMVYVVPPPQNSAGPRWNDGLTQSTLPWQSYGPACRGNPQPPPRQAGLQAQYGTGKNAGSSSSSLTHV